MSEMDSFLATVPLFRELGAEELREIAPLIREERYAAGTMYLLFGAGSSPGYQLAQPWLGNFAVYRTHALGSDGNEVFPKMWIDNTKKN